MKIDLGMVSAIFGILFGLAGYLNSMRKAKKDEVSELRARVSELEIQVRQLREERDDYARKLAKIS